jgi:hypothetical protein
MMWCPWCEEYNFDGTECTECPYTYDVEEDEE